MPLLLHGASTTVDGTKDVVLRIIVKIDRNAEVDREHVRQASPHSLSKEDGDLLLQPFAMMSLARKN